MASVNNNRNNSFYGLRSTTNLVRQSYQAHPTIIIFVTTIISPRAD